MIGPPQHVLARWLIEILDPVLKFYSYYWIPVSFQFASYIHKLQRSNNTEYLVTFDISSLFTNVAIDETMDICADYLYRGPLQPLSFPENVFVQMMEMFSKSVSFSFNNIMHRKNDGLSMSNPLRPLRANIFFGFQ